MWVFPDENNFFQDQLHNIQNNRWLAYNPYGIPRIMKSKFFHSVMVSAHVSSDGDIMTFYIFELGLRLNKDDYIKLLVTLVTPCQERVVGGRPYMWQQDSSSCYIPGMCQKWLLENFNNFTHSNFWPTNSPDCNPMDYYVWSAVEKDTNNSACNTKAELMAKIKEVFEDLPMDTLRDICSGSILMLWWKLRGATLSGWFFCFLILFWGIWYCVFFSYANFKI